MQNKQEQWAVLKRLMSYLKSYGLLIFLALSFLLATTVIKSVIPSWLPTLSTSISAILTN